MDPVEKPQQAIRRSTRLPLEVPVRITSLDPAVALSEDCNTTLVNAHGCGLIAKREISRGLRVRLEIVSAQRHTTAVVSDVVPLGGSPETWLVGLQLDVPGNFWGIDYAPADWKIEETAGLAAGPREDACPAGKPAGRWRLTDITTGACYLQTDTPFAAGTPALLSIRAAGTECLLDGMVRVSHAQAGMGVEFTNPEQGRQIEELIGRLTSTRDVPRIFVGRKEGKQREEALRQAAQRHDPASTDPLLQLVRQGARLSLEQFFSDLEAQRLGHRREPRIEAVVPVLLTGIDDNGRPLDQRVTTSNISHRGAKLEGVHGRLRPGARVTLARAHRRESFRVEWVGEVGSEADGQIGVSAVELDSTFWDEILQSVVSSR